MTVDSKGILATVHAMNAHMRSGGINPFFPKICTRWRWVIIFMLCLLFSCSKSF